MHAQTSPALGICVSNLGPEIWIVGVCQYGAAERSTGMGGPGNEKYGGRKTFLDGASHSGATNTVRDDVCAIQSITQLP